MVSSSFKGLPNEVVAQIASLAGSVEMFNSQAPVTPSDPQAPDFSCPSTGRRHAPSPRDLKALKDTDEGGRQTNT